MRPYLSFSCYQDIPSYNFVNFLSGEDQDANDKEVSF